jgi:large subunit ribosomal protein L4e
LRAHRNIPGLEACNVHKLNLLQLAPGGTLGRFIIWSSASMKALNNVFGTYDAPSVEKKNWSLPRSIMQNADV